MSAPAKPWVTCTHDDCGVVAASPTTKLCARHDIATRRGVTGRPVKVMLDTSGNDPAWRDRAACRTTDPDLHFPVGDTGPAAAQIIDAKAVCARCPVRAECLRWALATGQNHGVWGGKTEDERRAIVRGRARRNRGN